MNIPPKVESAVSWLEDSANAHAASGKDGFAQHNRNAAKLLLDQNRVVENLAMIVRMLQYALSKRAPGHSSLAISTKYLREHGLEGSLLRDLEAASEGLEPTP